MIQPEELRIGNVIFINDSLRTVEGVVGDQVWFKKEKHLSQDLISNCNPVPLTEEWLLRMGFEKEEHQDFGVVFENKSVGRITPRGEMWTFWPEELHGFSVEIQFVHQLQNLVFVFLGTELTIKG